MAGGPAAGEVIQYPADGVAIIFDESCCASHPSPKRPARDLPAAIGLNILRLAMRAVAQQLLAIRNGTCGFNASPVGNHDARRHHLRKSIVDAGDDTSCLVTSKATKRIF